MASIQQSINQLTSGVLGAATSTSLLYTQTPMYKSGIMNRKAQAMKEIGRDFGGTSTPTGRRYLNQAADLEIEARILHPSSKNLRIAEEAEGVKDFIAEEEQ